MHNGFFDQEGIRHPVQVPAESLYEAGLGRCEHFGNTTIHLAPSPRLEIELFGRRVTHALTVKKVREWLDGACRSPNEKIAKERLKGPLASERECGPLPPNPWNRRADTDRLRLPRRFRMIRVDQSSFDSFPEADVRTGDREAMLYCPVCSLRLTERKCKLLCERCGYYMSCADYY